jgi:hypothetical protein
MRRTRLACSKPHRHNRLAIHVLLLTRTQVAKKGKYKDMMQDIPNPKVITMHDQCGRRHNHVHYDKMQVCTRLLSFSLFGPITKSTPPQGTPGWRKVPCFTLAHQHQKQRHNCVSTHNTAKLLTLITATTACVGTTRHTVGWLLVALLGTTTPQCDLEKRVKCVTQCMVPNVALTHPRMTTHPKLVQTKGGIAQHQTH